jgi:hypothetical protein
MDEQLPERLRVVCFEAFEDELDWWVFLFRRLVQDQASHLAELWGPTMLDNPNPVRSKTIVCDCVSVSQYLNIRSNIHPFQPEESR